MAYAIMAAGNWTEILGPFTVGEGIDLLQYSADWPDRASADERAALGATEIVEDLQPAAYASIVDVALVDVDGMPRRRYVVEPLSLEDTRTARLADLAALRWAGQQTMAWADRQAPADDVTLGRIMAAYQRAQISGSDMTTTVRWKFGAGDFADLSINDLVAYGVAIGTHMQGCYDHEADLSAQLLAAPDRDSLIAIDITAGWPA